MECLHSPGIQVPSQKVRLDPFRLELMYPVDLLLRIEATRGDAFLSITRLRIEARTGVWFPLQGPLRVGSWTPLKSLNNHFSG